MPLLKFITVWFYNDFAPDGAEAVRKYHILDFSNWKDHAAFEAPLPG